MKILSLSVVFNSEGVIKGGVENRYSTQPTIKERGRKRTCDPQCKVCLSDGAMIVTVAHACKPQCRLAHSMSHDWRANGLFSREKNEKAVVEYCTSSTPPCDSKGVIVHPKIKNCLGASYSPVLAVVDKIWQVLVASYSPVLAIVDKIWQVLVASYSPVLAIVDKIWQN